MKKSHELSSERAAVRELAHKLHQLNLEAKLYNERRSVAFRWTEGLPFGPMFIRNLRRLPQEDQREVMVRVLNPREEPLVAQTETGAIAIWNQSPKRDKALVIGPRFETFDFERGSSEDFHIVKAALQKHSRAARSVVSAAEYSDQRDPNSPNYRGR